MGDKEQERIESLLKKRVNKGELAPFEERWETIKSELDFDRREEGIIEEQVPILVRQGARGGSDNYDRLPLNKVKLISIITSIFLIMVLSIVLPIIINKKERSYFLPADLAGEVVTEVGFYEGIEKSGIELVDLTRFHCQEFSLLKTTSGDVHGGFLSVNNEMTNEIVKVSFFSKFVKVPNYDFTEPETYNKNGAIVYYEKLDNNEEVVQYQAYAKFKDVTYKLDYYCITDNVLEFFNNFFI